MGAGRSNTICYPGTLPALCVSPATFSDFWICARHLEALGVGLASGIRRLSKVLMLSVYRRGGVTVYHAYSMQTLGGVSQCDMQIVCKCNHL